MLTLLHHIGLGDLILLSGAIVRLAEQHGQIRIFCYEHHLASVRSFFTGHPGVIPVPVWRNHIGPYGVPDKSILPGLLEPVIRTGYYAGAYDRADISFPELFYSQLGFEYSVRWDFCPIQKAAASVPQQLSQSTIFVHDDPGRGYQITSKLIKDKQAYRPAENGGSILEYVEILRGASEIHCIDSAFYHLVESLGDITAELYYHRYARPYIPGWFDYPKRYNWTLVV